MPIRFLNAEQLRRALPMAEAIRAMKSAYAQLSSGEADLPLRSRIGLPKAEGVTLFMPAYLPQDDGLAVKIVSVFPHNPEHGLPTIHALVVVLDSATGQPVGLIEGGSLTAIRTGAGSGAATDILARGDASTVVIIGSGVQARTQLEAVCCVRNIQRVLVYSPHHDHAQAFAAQMAGQDGIPNAIELAGSAAEAIEVADIVCTATTSHKPVFNGRRLKRGSHVNAVGSFTPEMAELDLATLTAARVVVDSRQAVLEEAGEFIQPIRTGAYDAAAIHAELGEIILGRAEGRSGPDEITLFKSVGVAVQDAAAAAAALRVAEAEGLGQLVDL
jgi:ornithine cyclodeaminase/alanine dehydrogenase-like protein (mu-crystallin family)